MPTLAVSIIAFHCETLELRGDYTARRPLNCQQPIDLKDRGNRKATCERLTLWNQDMRDNSEKEQDVHLGRRGIFYRLLHIPLMNY